MVFILIICGKLNIKVINAKNLRANLLYLNNNEADIRLKCLRTKRMNTLPLKAVIKATNLFKSRNFSSIYFIFKYKVSQFVNYNDGIENKPPKYLTIFLEKKKIVFLTIKMLLIWQFKLEVPFFQNRRNRVVFEKRSFFTIISLQQLSELKHENNNLSLVYYINK